MKDFFNKYKKYILLFLLFVVVAGLAYWGYTKFIQDSQDVEDESITNTVEEVTPRPEYDERGSSEAILATYESAKVWASDAKLYDCSGLTLSSVQFPDVTYEYLGEDQGKYSQWICTYYSESLGMTRIYSYEEGFLDDTLDAMEIGEYGYLKYGDITYPTDLSSIVDSSDIYQTALDNDLNVTDNYVNMYLGDTSDYGYVWRLEERDKDNLDENDIAVIVNTYIFDLNGDLVEKTAEEVY